MNITHYLYFNIKPDAEKAEQEIVAKGYKTELSFLDYGDGQWSLIVHSASKDNEDTMDVMNADEDFLTEVVERHNGEYDGNEVEI